MKTNRLNYFYVLLIAALTLNIGCGSDDNGGDDGPVTADLVVTTEDFTADVTGGALLENGDVIGEVVGRSNQGAVSFALTSQTPNGAMAIDASTGSLTVADATLFEINGQVTGVASITKDATVKTANITVNVLAPQTISCDTPAGFEIDLSAFFGDVTITDYDGSGAPVLEDDGVTPSFQSQGTGAFSNECARVAITGDIINFSCENAENITLEFGFAAPTDGNTGDLIFDNDGVFTLVCNEDTDEGFGQTYELRNLTGTYDLSNSLIVFSYSGWQVGAGENGEDIELFSQQTGIAPGQAAEDDDDDGNGGTGETYEIPDFGAACNGAVDVTTWVGDLTVTEIFGEDTFETPVTAVAGDEECTLVITGGILAYGCDDAVYTLHLLPGESGAASGTIAEDEQLYPCADFYSPDGTVPSIKFNSGTYDTSTGEIIINYGALANGDELFGGELTITVASGD